MTERKSRQTAGAKRTLAMSCRHFMPEADFYPLEVIAQVLNITPRRVQHLAKDGDIHGDRNGIDSFASCFGRKQLASSGPILCPTNRRVDLWRDAS
jgi:hypothetical protein